MSESEEDRAQVKEVDTMPAYKMRFTDMPQNLYEKAIKRKSFRVHSPMFAVIAKCNANTKFDKDVACAIQKALATDADLQDDCAGWHIIVGKSFASSIQYQTKFVLFFDLLGENFKTFLMFKTQ